MRQVPSSTYMAGRSCLRTVSAQASISALISASAVRSDMILALTNCLSTPEDERGFVCPTPDLIFLATDQVRSNCSGRDGPLWSQTAPRPVQMVWLSKAARLRPTEPAGAGPSGGPGIGRQETLQPRWARAHLKHRELMLDFPGAESHSPWRLQGQCLTNRNQCGPPRCLHKFNALSSIQRVR